MGGSRQFARAASYRVILITSAGAHGWQLGGQPGHQGDVICPLLRLCSIISLSSIDYRLSIATSPIPRPPSRASAICHRRPPHASRTVCLRIEVIATLR
jgi:hypothetical protein